MYPAGEMIVGPKKTLLMDEISTGLDSSTTFQIIKCLRDFAHLRLGTVFISLLQPPPEVYNLFDDILLLSEGAQLHSALTCLRTWFCVSAAWFMLCACSVHAFFMLSSCFVHALSMLCS